MLKYTADIKTLIYMSITTALFIFMWMSWETWSLGGWAFAGFYALHLFMAVTVSVIAHCIMHKPMFKAKPLNRMMEYWVTLFYGTPVFGWIPTHNRNHHHWNNREPDYTKTYRASEANNVFTLIFYPFISNYYQSIANKEFLQDRYRKNKREFWYYISQIVLVVGWFATFCYLNWVAAIFLIVIPHQFSLYTVVFFNYIQHVHADEESEYNHSRNWISTHFLSLNWLLFNNGFHTIHHINANIHWSELPEAHAKIADKIDDSLIEKSFWGYLFRVYILGAFSSKYRTKSMRLERIAKEEKQDNPQAAVA